MSLEELFSTDELPWQTTDPMVIDSLFSTAVGNWEPPSAPSTSDNEAASAALLQGTVSLPLAPPSALEAMQPAEDAASKEAGDGKEEEGLLVTVPRHKLVKMTRVDFDAFVREATGGRKLTKEEVVEVRRQRKLIKNRISASVCRKRKRAQVNQMEAKLKALQDRLDATSGLEQKARALEERNRQLEERMQELESKATAKSVTTPRCILAPTTTPETLDLTLMRKILECSPTLLQMYKQLQFYQKQLKCSSADMKQAAVILTYTMAELNLLLATNLNTAKLTAAYGHDSSQAAFSMTPQVQSIPAPTLPVTQEPVVASPDTQPTIDGKSMELLASFLAHKSAEAAAAAALTVDAPTCTAASL
mmetsp:Transcript_71610/g.99498  ORF Transcript_71610/g.99498 Transcript_71610/m.99498 type:complete len:362 (-) Transcript_71610:34-1119(-)